jgi:hypothetical protein
MITIAFCKPVPKKHRRKLVAQESSHVCSGLCGGPALDGVLGDR